MQEILNEIVRGLTQMRRIFNLFKRGVANPPAHWSKHIIMVYPQAASRLNSPGFNQERLENYLYERTSIPFEEMGPDEVNSLQDRIRGSREGGMLLVDTIAPDRISLFEEA